MDKTAFGSIPEFILYLCPASMIMGRVSVALFARMCKTVQALLKLHRLVHLGQRMCSYDSGAARTFLNDFGDHLGFGDK
jgi:hypothetical protein